MTKLLHDLFIFQNYLTMKKLFLLAIIAIAGCANQSDNEPALRSEKSASVASFDTQTPQPTETSAVAVERKLIKNGDLLFETSDITKTKASIESICKTLNAYTANESQNNYEDRIQYNQTIRVPAEQFNVLLQELEALAVKVESKNINTQDVTEEFIDVEARLKTKKELENRYREILKEARSVSDIVSIESQISSVRSEIESMEGRLQYLKNQVSFSTLHVSYYEFIGTDFGFASKVVRALAQGWDNLLAFLIMLVNLWPFIVFAGVGIWAIKLIKSRKKA